MLDEKLKVERKNCLRSVDHHDVCRRVVSKVTEELVALLKEKLTNQEMHSVCIEERISISVTDSDLTRRFTSLQLKHEVPRSQGHLVSSPTSQKRQKSSFWKRQRGESQQQSILYSSKMKAHL